MYNDLDALKTSAAFSGMKEQNLQGVSVTSAIDRIPLQAAESIPA